jgi:hypothetical protein
MTAFKNPLSSTLTNTKREYKPGGMMIVGQDNIVGCMRVATGDDGMGRWM